ncbi:MAG: RDD family protein [Verrucomicrobiota bacterium]|jgi:uncharacterized RDD family membrane protein YckC
MASRKQSELLIQTPEGIRFSFTLAGPVIRCLAWMLDLTCILALTFVAGFLFAILNLLAADLVEAASMLAYFALSIGYGIICEWFWRGQTLGKRLFRLRVMDAQGLQLQFHQVVIRNLLRFVDMLPAFYLVGGIACLANRKAQRLGDLAANTIVVRNPKQTEPDLEQLLAGKYNSFRNYPHLEARLRQRVSPAEAAVALRALMRREEIEPDARVPLFADIAAHFREICPFPNEAADGLTDEQYVRNVVDILYRKRAAAKREAENLA